jgi:predicted glycosyltransferase
LSRLKNYTIEPDANVHDLIMNSDVIIALQSTTAAESAIAGKPVIFPLFYNFRQTKIFNNFIWKDYLDLFDVAEGPDELESLVVERLRNPEVNENIMEGRRGLFKKVFSDIEGVALERYVETIKNVLNSAKSRN